MSPCSRKPSPRCPQALGSALAGLTLLAVASTAGAALTPEQRCHADRLKAGARYSSCVLKAFGKQASGIDYYKLVALLGRCQAKYADQWLKIQATASGTGSTCDAPRFVDGGDGSVTDNLTGLQWEQKTDDGTVHDRDNLYSWALGYSEANGTASTVFLSTLNTACFANHCDWRLPTIAELLTIVSAPYPACESPCIDPIFGATIGSWYWSATPLASDEGSAWYVQFTAGLLGDHAKLNLKRARAVRTRF